MSVEQLVPYLEFPLPEKFRDCESRIFTRLGGVSEGCFSSMNLSFDRGDRPRQSTGKFPKNGKCDWSGMRGYGAFTADPYHNVRLVTEKDRGKGIVRERDYTDVDGL